MIEVVEEVKCEYWDDCSRRDNVTRGAIKATCATCENNIVYKENAELESKKKDYYKRGKQSSGNSIMSGITIIIILIIFYLLYFCK